MTKLNSSLCLEDLYRIFNNLNVGAIIIDASGSILWGNQYYSNLAQFNISDYYGKNIAEISKHEHVKLPENKLMFAAAFQEKKEIRKIVKYNTDDYVISTITPIFNGEKQVDYYLYTITNCSESIRIQKELSLVQARTLALEEQLHEIQYRELLGNEIVVKNRDMKQLFKMGAKLSNVSASVMILGESGVGKDVLAKFIHNHGERKNQPFINVNLGAIPKELFESQLFGYAPGAFTGASKNGKLGLIQLADKGTLFLNEIGELPLDIQVKLLQVLQDKTVRAIGSTETISVDVRIISATNRNLIEMVQKGEFRADLFYRLNVVELKIPPLRERTEDIPFLVYRFLQEFNERYHVHKEISPDVMRILQSSDWPGNIRELRHMIERLVVLTQDKIIDTSQLPIEFQESALTNRFESKISDFKGLKGILSQVEKEIITDALKNFPTAAAAADYLKIDSSTLTKKRKKYEI